MADCAVAGALDNAQLDHLVLQLPQGPAGTAIGRRGAGERDQLGFRLTVENPKNRRRHRLLAAQDSLNVLFHQLLAHPVNHRRAGLQGSDDLVVALACACLRRIRLQ